MDGEAHAARYTAEATGRYEGGWEADPRVRMLTGTVERAADALLIVAGRFMCVGQTGQEYGPQVDFRDREDTPNSVRVTLGSEAALCVADTKDSLSHAMAASMKRILEEELTRAGVSALVSPDYNPIRGISAGRGRPKDDELAAQWTKYRSLGSRKAGYARRCGLLGWGSASWERWTSSTIVGLGRTSCGPFADRWVTA